MNHDINVKKMRLNCFRQSKVPGEFMLQMRVPGGMVDAKYLSYVEHIANTWGDGNFHFGTRQTFDITGIKYEDIPAVNAMLGTPYAIRFPVQHGAGLGRTLGVPTINQIYPEGYQLPRYGIYITRTWIKGRAYPSATGLGTRPTVNDDSTKVTCETFIPGFYGDLYGTDPVVEFHTYLSPSKKFDTLDELRDCIRHAARRAEEYFRK